MYYTQLWFTSQLKFSILGVNFVLIAERLQMLMEEANLNKYRLHKALGCSITAITNWLTGKKAPDSASLIKMSKHFGVSVDYLLGLTDERCPCGRVEPDDPCATINQAVT